MVEALILYSLIALGLGSTYLDSVSKHSLEGKIELIWKRTNTCIETHENKNRKKLYPKFIKREWEGNNPDPVLYFKLPAGLDLDKVAESIPALISGLKAEVQIKWLENDIDHDFSLKILSGKLRDFVVFQLEDILKKLKPNGLWIPLGWSRRGLEQQNLADPNTPHLLIGGTTGGGKSSLLRLIITICLLTYKPKELELWFADMKDGAEFAIFDRVPHLKRRITRPNEVEQFLFDLREEEYRRLRLFKEINAVNIKKYNAKTTKEKLPRIMLCIDELNMVEGKDYDDARQILQDVVGLGRATGVSLVVATHRPDGKVMSGTLKNNLTCKVGFWCDPVSTRVLLGETNTHLMKYISPDIKGRSVYLFDKPIYMQVPWLDEDIAEALVDSIKVDIKSSTPSLSLVKSL